MADWTPSSPRELYHWKTFDRPPELQETMQQPVLPETSYKYIEISTIRFKSPEDISIEGEGDEWLWVYEVAREKAAEHPYVERLTCDDMEANPDESSHIAVGNAITYILRGGLTEQRGDLTTYYDPDGSQDDYRTGECIESWARLYGFTTQELEQISDDISAHTNRWKHASSEFDGLEVGQPVRVKYMPSSHHDEYGYGWVEYISPDGVVTVKTQDGHPWGKYHYEDLEPVMTGGPVEPEMSELVKWKRSHVFDPKQVTLDPLVFDHEDRLLPRLQKFIQHAVEEVFARHTGMGHQYFDVYLSGPMTTYRFNPISDADLYIVPTYDQLPAHSNADEVHSFLQKKCAEHIDGTQLPGTRHRLHSIVSRPGVTLDHLFNKSDRPAWNVTDHNWYIAPARHHSDESKALDHHMQRTHEIADKLTQLDGQDKHEYRKFLKRRAEEEPMPFSGPMMIFQFLDNQKLAGILDTQKAQQTMDSIKDSQAYKSLLQKYPDRANHLDSFTENAVWRDPQAHPIYWQGINSVAGGTSPMVAQQHMRATMQGLQQLHDNGDVHEPWNHAAIQGSGDLSEARQGLYTLTPPKVIPKGDTIYTFPDGWHIDLESPEEYSNGPFFNLYKQDNAISEGRVVSYYLRDPDGDTRAYLKFDSTGDPEHRPHTLHEGSDPDGAWEITAIDQENTMKGTAKKSWNMDETTTEHVREWFQHLRTWGVKFNPRGVEEEGPHIDSPSELLEWYEENVENGDYRDPKDPYGFNASDAPQPPDTGYHTLEEIIKPCLDSCSAGASSGYHHRGDYVNDPEQLADALHYLYLMRQNSKIDYEDPPWSRLCELASEEFDERVTDWIHQNYEHFDEEAYDFAKENYSEYFPKDVIYKLDAARDDDEDLDAFDDLFDELWHSRFDSDTGIEEACYDIQGKIEEFWVDNDEASSAMRRFDNRMWEIDNGTSQSSWQQTSSWAESPPPSAWVMAALREMYRVLGQNPNPSLTEILTPAVMAILDLIPPSERGSGSELNNKLYSTIMFASNFIDAGQPFGTDGVLGFGMDEQGWAQAFKEMHEDGVLTEIPDKLKTQIPSWGESPTHVFHPKHPFMVHQNSWKEGSEPWWREFGEDQFSEPEYGFENFPGELHGRLPILYDLNKGLWVAEPGDHHEGVGQRSGINWLRGDAQGDIAWEALPDGTVYLNVMLPRAVPSNAKQQAYHDAFMQAEDTLTSYFGDYTDLPMTFLDDNNRVSSSTEHLRVIYDFDGDTISLGTTAEAEGNRRIEGHYDGTDVHLEQPTDAWFNVAYFKRLWKYQFPDRPLNEVHVAVTKTAMTVPVEDRLHGIIGEVVELQSNWYYGKLISDPNIEIEMQVFEDPSQFGVSEGRVSKLWMHNVETGQTVIQYDRGWVIHNPQYDGIVKQIIEAIDYGGWTPQAITERDPEDLVN